MTSGVRGQPIIDPRLGGLLRRIRREQTSLTGDDAAAKLRWSPSKMSRIERCKTGVHLDDLEDLMRLYAVSSAQRTEIMRLADAAVTAAVLTGNMGQDRINIIYREQCDKAYTWGPSVIPPSLRTTGYAKAVARSLQDILGILPSEIEAAAGPAEAWEARLLSPRQPLQMRAVVDATALHRLTGSKQVMAAQIAYLTKLAARPNVTIRVTALDAIGVPAGVPAFTVLSFNPGDSGEMPDVMFTDDDSACEPQPELSEPVTWRARRTHQQLHEASDPAARALAAATAQW